MVSPKVIAIRPDFSHDRVAQCRQCQFRENDKQLGLSAREVPDAFEFESQFVAGVRRRVFSRNERGEVSTLRSGG